MKIILIILLLSTAVLAGNGVWYPYPPSSGSGSGGQGNTGPTGASPWGISGSATYYTAGPVGIGTNNPSGSLVVSNNLSASNAVVSIMGSPGSTPAASVLFDAEYNQGILDASFVSSGTTVVEGNHNSVVLTTLSGVGYADLSAANNQYIKYDNTSLSGASGLNQTGCVRIRMIPTYSSGVQSDSGGSTFVLWTSDPLAFTAGSDNGISIAFNNNGDDALVDIYDQTASSNLFPYPGGEIPITYTAGTMTELELDFDASAGLENFFQDGVAIATTHKTGTRNTVANPLTGGMVFGAVTSDGSAAFKVTAVVISNTVCHTSNFTSPIAPLGVGAQGGDYLDLSSYLGIVLAKFDNIGNFFAPMVTVSGTTSTTNLAVSSTSTIGSVTGATGVWSGAQTWAGTGTFTAGPVQVGTSGFFGTGYEQETIEYSPSANPPGTSYSLHVDMAPTGNTAMTANYHDIAATLTRTIGSNTTDTSQQDALLLAVKYAAPSGVTYTNSNATGMSALSISALKQSISGSTIASRYQAIEVQADTASVTGYKTGLFVGPISNGTENAMIADNVAYASGGLWGINFANDTKNSFAGSMTIGGAITAPNLPSSVAALDYLCWNEGSGAITTDSSGTCLSSLRDQKENIEDLKNGLAEIMALRPVAFDYKPEFNPNHLPRQVGFIAEEVQAVDRRIAGYDTKTGKLRSVSYQTITAPLVAAIQEQQKEIEELKEEIIDLKRGR